MKVLNCFIALMWFFLVVLCIAPDTYASEVKQGDKVTIVVPGTMARLCPYPNCGQDQHITRGNRFGSKRHNGR